MECGEDALGTGTAASKAVVWDRELTHLVASEIVSSEVNEGTSREWHSVLLLEAEILVY
jgi:hypothetical protein